MAESLAHLSAALADRYRLEREVGQGGMATVYLAHDVRHDRKVALKVLRPELSAILGAQRFLAEIKTTANLQHPHILSLFDSGEADGLVFYVMPYVEGESLRVRLAREKQLPVDEAIRIAREIADALDYAHRHGVIHRDIKPENILLHDGRALVADFGIALAAARSDSGTRMTETGMSLGTPHYMSPEQAMGEREITAKSDVYALGCVTYEMLTGEPPFTGPTAQAIIARVMTEEPRSLTIQRKSIPPHVEAAVVTALSKLPADRFATAALFGEALIRPGAATVVTTAARRGLPGSKVAPLSRALALAPWALALLALGAAVWSWRGRPARQGTSWQYISLGDSLTPTLGVPSLALSPDGASLVVRDNVQNGMLWLKRRGALNAVRIAGTERSNHPVFSPDGQWVLFYADGRIRKIRPGEGGAVTLADSADATLGGGDVARRRHHRLRRTDAERAVARERGRRPEHRRLAGPGTGGLRDRLALGASRRPGRAVHRLQLRLRDDARASAGPAHRTPAAPARWRGGGLVPADRSSALRPPRWRRRSRRHSTSRISGSPVRRCRCSMACSRTTARRSGLVALRSAGLRAGHLRGERSGGGRG